MNSWRGGPMVAVLLCLAGCTQPGTCTLSLASKIPMTLAESGRRIIVPASLDRQPLSLLVDTGATMTVLSDAAVPDRYRRFGSTTVSGIGGDRDLGLAVLDKVQLGQLSGGVQTLSTSESFTFGGRTISGVIGMNVLGAYDVDLDLPGRTMRLYEAKGDCSKTTAALAQPVYGVPVLPGEHTMVEPRFTVSVGGHTLTALLDTGSPDTAIFRETAATLGITRQMLASDPSGTARGIGRVAERAHIHLLDEIQIGDLALHNVPVEIIDQYLHGLDRIDMILGMDFAERVHLWLSNSSHVIVMQFPPSPSEAPEHAPAVASNADAGS